jgi:hypothetical protein
MMKQGSYGGLNGPIASIDDQTTHLPFGKRLQSLQDIRRRMDLSTLHFGIPGKNFLNNVWLPPVTTAQRIMENSYMHFRPRSLSEISRFQAMEKMG